MPSTRKRFYVGQRNGFRQVFSSLEKPTDASHGDDYTAVIGPFRTRAGAEFMRKHGENNPHCRTVRDAENLAMKVRNVL